LERQRRSAGTAKLGESVLTSGHPFAQESPVAAKGRALDTQILASFGGARLPNYGWVFATSWPIPIYRVQGRSVW